MMASTSLYEHYNFGGNNTGLSANQSYFTLNGKNVTIFSGAMHYFRVPQPYWRDRLRKMKYAGLNTVETYVPWNLHEPQPGHFDFGNGGSDMQDFLDITTFLKTVQEEDLFAIVRPGPYICSEFEFGGLPSWLLREDDIKIRTSDEKFMKHVTRFFNALLPLLVSMQFTRGGPIIALQVENEYGSTEGNLKPRFKPDLVYMEKLRQLFLKNDIIELLFTSDSPSIHGAAGTLPGILLQTANFANNPENEFDKLKQLQSNKPSMAMEYWSGWFSHWSEQQFRGNVSAFRDVLERILKYPASVNFYMFHGGTTWGFLNGANVGDDGSQASYQPDISSYDYDAPLTECGDYTEKFFVVKELIEKYSGVKSKLAQPAKPQLIEYPSLQITQFLSYSDLIKQLPDKILSPDVKPMELLPINNNAGQSYGYVIYRKQKLDLKANSILKIDGHVYDIVQVYVNGKLISKRLENSKDLDGFGYWRLANGTITLTEIDLVNATVDLMVENMGRNNFGRLDYFKQFKGLRSNIYVNDKRLCNWQIMPLEFKKNWTNNLVDWQEYSRENTASGLYRGRLNVDKPMDTFLDMSGWTKGIAIVNGFVLGRYMHIGPQQTLYLPAPLLRQGSNDIIIFEQFTSNDTLTFSQKPIYHTK